MCESSTYGCEPGMCSPFLSQNFGLCAQCLALEGGPPFKCQNSSIFDGMVDNALACIARLISKYGRLLMSQKMEWFAWFRGHVMPKFLGALPIRADQDEKATVYKAFVDLAALCVAEQRYALVEWILSEVYRHQRAMFAAIRDLMRKAFQSKPKVWSQIEEHCRAALSLPPNPPTP